MKKNVAGIIILIFLAFSGTTSLLPRVSANHSNQPNQPNASELSGVANSLLSRYNKKVGLVYESNTAGNHTISPDYQLNRTYWIWNDNAQAVWGLRGYNNRISNAINATIQDYVNEFNLPSPDYDEVFWGIGLSSNVIYNQTYGCCVVTNGTNFVVLAEIHNGTGNFSDWDKYENLVVIHSLNNYINNNYAGAIDDFRLAENMWNGLGMNDTVVNPSSPVYDSYKLAAIIFDAKVLNLWDDTMTAIQNELWNLQLPDGGIRTGYGSGEPTSQVNSTNSETDSLTLMAYNMNLISRIRYSVQLTSNVHSLTISEGSSSSFNVTAIGNDQDLTLSHAPLPIGIKLSFDKSATVGISNIITVKVTKSAEPKTYQITIKATGEDLEKSSVNVSITVTRATVVFSSK